MPVNRLETHMLRWLSEERERGKEEGQQGRLVEQILLFYPEQEAVLENMLEVDLKQSGLVNFCEFYKWIQVSAIPCGREEAKRVFDRESRVVGRDGLQGVRAEKLLEYGRFLNDVYGVGTEARGSSGVVEKYSSENLNRQKVAHQRTVIHHLNHKIVSEWHAYVGRKRWRRRWRRSARRAAGWRARRRRARTSARAGRSTSSG